MTQLSRHDRAMISMLEALSKTPSIENRISDFMHGLAEMAQAGCNPDDVVKDPAMQLLALRLSVDLAKVFDLTSINTNDGINSRLHQCQAISIAKMLRESST